LATVVIAPLFERRNMAEPLPTTRWYMIALSSQR
jgi:hypothetical protein